MKLGGSQYIEDLDPERFLYLKSVFAIKDCTVIDSKYTGLQILRGNFEDLTVFSEWFREGKYTL